MPGTEGVPERDNCQHCFSPSSFSCSGCPQNIAFSVWPPGCHSQKEALQALIVAKVTVVFFVLSRRGRHMGVCGSCGCYDSVFSSSTHISSPSWVIAAFCQEFRSWRRTLASTSKLSVSDLKHHFPFSEARRGYPCHTRKLVCRSGSGSALAGAEMGCG